MKYNFVVLALLSLNIVYADKTGIQVEDLIGNFEKSLSYQESYSSQLDRKSVG